MIKSVFALIVFLLFAFNLSAQGKVKFGIYGGAGYGMSNTVKKTISPANSLLSPAEYVDFGIGRTRGYYTDFDINYRLKFKSKGTYHLGFDLEIRIKDKLRLVTGMQYLHSSIELESDNSVSIVESSFVEKEMQLGSWNIPQADFVLLSEFRNELYQNLTFSTDFIELPVKLKVEKVVNNFNFEAGFYIRYVLWVDSLIRAQKIQNFGLITEIVSGGFIGLQTPSLNDWGYGLLGAIEYDLTNRVSLRLQLKSPMWIGRTEIREFIFNPDDNILVFSQLDLKYTFGKDR